MRFLPLAQVILVIPLSAGSVVTAQTPEPSVRGTQWRLTSLGDKAVKGSDARNEPTLVLDQKTTSFSGSGGCNRISGTYELKGDSLTFGPVVATRMMCPTIDVEAEYIRALSDGKKWRIADRKLELLGAKGEVVARFEEAEAKPKNPGER
jgi:heat shock protein HslJ